MADLPSRLPCTVFPRPDGGVRVIPAMLPFDVPAAYPLTVAEWLGLESVPPGDAS
ncbi:hypothetical protein ACFOWE_18150 [Planomonospora corallina]|uniref:Uncharacterized protein n=1 Tax=Planomonospora corallina TaxID=1806052 RepID=A0ABV8I8L8_9ACTN